MPILHGESNRRNKRTRNKMSLKIDMTDLRVDNSPAHNCLNPLKNWIQMTFYMHTKSTEKF